MAKSTDMSTGTSDDEEGDEDSKDFKGGWENDDIKDVFTTAKEHNEGDNNSGDNGDGAAAVDGASAFKGDTVVDYDGNDAGVNAINDDVKINGKEEKTERNSIADS